MAPHVITRRRSIGRGHRLRANAVPGRDSLVSAESWPHLHPRGRRLLLHSSDPSHRAGSAQVGVEISGSSGAEPRSARSEALDLPSFG